MDARVELSTGEALVGLLESYGVSTVFGIPGVHNIEMYRALPRSKIVHILPRHEQGAGFMADGYARTTGRPGVCFTISGPGLLNILTPLGQAHSDSSPVLVISTALDSTDSAQGRGRLHEMQNQHAAASSITSLNVEAKTPQDLRDGVARIFAEFASRRPRAAYIELPIDLLNQPCGEGWTARPRPGRPLPHPDDVERAVSLLESASNPMLLFGGGAVDAAPEARAVLEKTGAIAFTTIAGKGVIPSNHPLCLGSRLPQDAAKNLLKTADVILAAGSEISETDLWEQFVTFPGKLIRIDIDPATLARPHVPEVVLLADAKQALGAVASRLDGKIANSRRSKNESTVREFLANESRVDDPLRTTLTSVLTVIRECLPDETIIASDTTQIAYAANEIFPMSHPRRWLHPVGFGTLGFALPAAIGAKVGAPAQPVAALIGDYGFQYTANELGTSAELNQPLVILLWNNEGLGMIRDIMIQRGVQPNAVTLKNPDFQMLAKANGCHAEKPESLAALARAIGRALAADRPTLIEMTPRMAHS